jgi:hypothetical protein
MKRMHGAADVVVLIHVWATSPAVHSTPVVCSEVFSESGVVTDFCGVYLELIADDRDEFCPDIVVCSLDRVRPGFSGRDESEELVRIWVWRYV